MSFKIHTVVVGACEVADTELLGTIITAENLDIIICLFYEDAVDMVVNAPVDLVLIGKYTQSENQIGEADEAALEICRQNSQKLVELCQQRRLSHVLIDAEKSPTWPDDLKKFLA